MPLPATLAGVRPVLVRPVRRLFLGQLAQSLGNGMTLALLVLYLTSVRGIPMTQATSLLALKAILGLALSPIFGTFVDRFGPRPVLLVSLFVEASGIFLLGRATSFAAAAACVVLMALGEAGTWGPFTALIARIVPPQHRSAAFGLHFMLLNLGLGLGGLIGASIIDLERPETFVLLYTVDAASYLIAMAAVIWVGNVGSFQQTEAAARGVSAEGSWREVLADRTLLRYAVAALAALTFGYGALDSGVAVYITDFVGLPAHAVGIAFAFNTMAIVVGQLWAIKVVAGRSRSRMLSATGILWASAWGLVGFAMGAPTWLAMTLLALGMVVYACGEILWSPVAPALLNDLAPEQLRGRYNAFQSILWSVSGAMGPLLTGVFLEHGAARAWTTTLAAGCLAAALLATRLRRHLTPAQDGRANHPAQRPEHSGVAEPAAEPSE